jgi:hypothetical protein
VDCNADGRRPNAEVCKVNTMVKQIQATMEELPKVLGEILPQAKEPLYRCLGKNAQNDYEKNGILTPYDGSMSVGCGVFFTNNLDYALGFLDDLLLVTDRTRIDPDQRAIDTRQKGYYAPIEEKLKATLGEGNYNGWTIEEEVQRNDTISYEGGPEGAYVFSKREPVGREKLLAEITIID